MFINAEKSCLSYQNHQSLEPICQFRIRIGNIKHGLTVPFNAIKLLKYYLTIQSLSVLEFLFFVVIFSFQLFEDETHIKERYVVKNAIVFHLLGIEFYLVL